MEVFYYFFFKLVGDMYYWYKIDEYWYGIIFFDMMGYGIFVLFVCMFILFVFREVIKFFVDFE